MKTKSPLPLCLLLTAPLFAQGPLDPPGPPAPSMKTAEQIEPRTPIESLPITISQPGSYYLTKSLTSAGDGIIINSSNVTVDLNGFSVSGSAPNTDGIKIAGAAPSQVSCVVVKNGTIDGFMFSITLVDSNESTLEDLCCHHPTNGGIFLQGGTMEGNTVRRCKVAAPNGGGITISGNGGIAKRNVIQDCIIGPCFFDGIRLQASSGVCSGNLILGNTIQDAGDSGIELNDPDTKFNRIERNHISVSVAASTVGIQIVGGTGNLVVKNSCAGHSDNFDLGTGNVWGPEVTAAGALPTTGSAAHPWANFSIGEPL